MSRVSLINLLLIVYLYKTDITDCADQLSSEPEFQPIEPCKSAQPPNNGTVNIWGNNMLVEFTCDDGLFPVGSTFGSCNVTSKTWSVEPPLCVSSACDPPANISHGQLFFDHSGSIVIAVCRRGYRLTGDRERYCDGYTWRGLSPNCKEMYPSRSERRQARNNGTTSETQQVVAADILEKHILDADNTCYQEFRDPPEVKNSTVEIIYKFNKVRRQWILIANYTCLPGYMFNDTQATYLYCKNYDWEGKATPACVNTVIQYSDPCETNNGGCEHMCVSHGKGTFRCECRPGFILGQFRRKCSDIDECRLDNGGCEQNCVNFVGSFFCTCNYGYVSDGFKCVDIDECNSPRQHQCPSDCINTPGSYRCNCSIPGFTASRQQTSCADYNECSDDNGGCKEVCINTVGSYQCRCKKKGYSLSHDAVSCEDTDECETNNGKCEDTCVNTVGSYKCMCLGESAVLNEDGHSCTTCDRYSFLDNKRCSPCPQNTIVNETVALASKIEECVCSMGFYTEKDSEGNCIDIDECADEPCDHNCTNVEGSYVCSCRHGYHLHDGSLCLDVDECSSGVLLCDQNCVNLVGDAYCTCDNGYEVSEDNITCSDIDECSNSTMNDCVETCINAVGSYRCDCFLGHALVGYNKCAPCPENFFRDENSTECVACPMNSITQGGGRTSIDDCTCIEGYQGKVTFENDCVKV